MAKTISFDYKGTKYTLEFTRASVRALENQGFKLSDIEDKPMSTLPTLFAGAFYAHHRFLKPAVIEEIFDNIKDKMGLITKLGEMYNEPIEALVDDPEEKEGNLNWEASW